MDTDKEILALEKEIWWHKQQHKARELYLLRRIEMLEKELARVKVNQNEFGDK
jgi:hypothetical protein